MFIHFNWFIKEKNRILKFMNNLIIFVNKSALLKNFDNSFKSKNVSDISKIIGE